MRSFARGHASATVSAFAVATLALAAIVAGCRDTSVKNKGCQADKDCGDPASAYRCETQTGECYCRTNQACLPTEFCNTIGFCQDRAGCEKNSDCLDPTLFCDTTTGTCLSQGRCTIDLHCPLGQVCDTSRNTCVDGCRTSGDCNGSSCRCGTDACVCTGKTQAEIQSCAIGVCDPNFCADENFCRFGENCGVVPDAGTDLKQCFNDFDPDRRPYCANCLSGGGVATCGNGPNFCLVDTAHPGNYYCGVDCSEGQSCPRGYGCQDVIVVGGGTLPQCTASNPACPTNQNLPCATDSECPRGGTCIKPSGQPNGYCAGKCAIDEGESVGFCTCMEDNDCAQESCSAGECSISRRPCVNQNDCRPIRCVDFNGAGGCLIGQNCAPDNGLSCNEVR